MFFFDGEGAKDYLEVYPGEQAHISINSGLQSLEGYHSFSELKVRLETENNRELIANSDTYKAYTDEMLSNADIQIISIEDIPVSVVEEEIVFKLEVEIPTKMLQLEAQDKCPLMDSSPTQ